VVRITLSSRFKLQLPTFGYSGRQTFCSRKDKNTPRKLDNLGKIEQLTFLKYQSNIWDIGPYHIGWNVLLGVFLSSESRNGFQWKLKKFQIDLHYY
jgi:hypothetical protein